MAKRRIKKASRAPSTRRSRKSRRPTRVPVKLGSSPAVHAQRLEEYARDSDTFLRDAIREADEGRCDVAFSRFVDGVSYAGMAEAEAKGAGLGAEQQRIAQRTIAAVRRFKTACRLF